MTTTLTLTPPVRIRRTAFASLLTVAVLLAGCSPTPVALTESGPVGVPAGAEQPVSVEPPVDDQPVVVEVPAEDPGTPASSLPDVTGGAAEPYEGPGTLDEPAYLCVEQGGEVVCDTFDEADEGPGTR